MIKKYFAMTIIAASISLAACSDDDDDETPMTPTPNPGGEMEVEENPGSGENPMPTAGTATPGEGGTAFDTIANSPDHTSLAAAVTAAGLADTLDAGEFTVFAPDNDAFAALGDNAPTGDDLARILTYHVVAGTQTSTVLSTSIGESTEDMPATLDTILVDGSGDAAVTQSLEFGLSDTAPSGVSVNDVAIDAVDLVLRGDDEDDSVAPSGIVHSIGTILIPPAAPVVEPGEGNVNPPGESMGVQADLEAAGNYAGFINLSSSIGVQSYDTNAWTVFAPTDEAIAADTATGDLSIQDHIDTSGAMAPAALLAAGTVTTNQGKSYTVTGTEAALLVDGKAVSVVATGAGGAQIYTIDGTLR